MRRSFRMATSSREIQHMVQCISEFAIAEFMNIKKEQRRPKNIPYAFCNIGGFGEELATYMYPDSIGGASKGGCAFDNKEVGETFKTIYAREIKTVSLDGSKKCTKCGTKSPRFQSKCLCCDSVEFKRMEDSRAGICSDAHVKYSDVLKETNIIVLKYNEMSKQIHLQVYRFDHDNPYFNTYIHNQCSNGKGKTANLLPFSYDWQLSGPSLLMECFVNEKGAVDMKYCDITNRKPCPISNTNYNTGKSVFRKKEIKEIFGEDVFESSDSVPYDPEKHSYMLRKKATGKSRGVTSRT